MAYSKYNRNGFSKKEEPKAYKQRRGKLAPLMTEEQKQNGQIQELSYDFGCRMARLYQYLTEDKYWLGITDYGLGDDYNVPHVHEYIFSKQLVRCGTSVGANVREAHHAQSDADFLSKMSIASKEADESDYWLNILHDNGYLNDSQFGSLNEDCQRINRILTSIIKKLKIKLGLM